MPAQTQMQTETPRDEGFREEIFSGADLVERLTGKRIWYPIYPQQVADAVDKLDARLFCVINALNKAEIPATTARVARLVRRQRQTVAPALHRLCEVPTRNDGRRAAMTWEGERGWVARLPQDAMQKYVPATLVFHPEVTDQALALWVLLSDLTDKEEFCAYPGKDFLGVQLAVSARHCRRAQALLVRLHALSVEESAKEHRYGRQSQLRKYTNRYSVLCPLIWVFAYVDGALMSAWDTPHGALMSAVPTCTDASDGALLSAKTSTTSNTESKEKPETSQSLRACDIPELNQSQNQGNSNAQLEPETWPGGSPRTTGTDFEQAPTQNGTQCQENLKSTCAPAPAMNQAQAPSSGSETEQLGPETEPGLTHHLHPGPGLAPTSRSRFESTHLHPGPEVKPRPSGLNSNLNLETTQEFRPRHHHPGSNSTQTRAHGFENKNKLLPNRTHICTLAMCALCAHTRAMNVFETLTQWHATPPLSTIYVDKVEIEGGEAGSVVGGNPVDGAGGFPQMPPSEPLGVDSPPARGEGSGAMRDPSAYDDGAGAHESRPEGPWRPSSPRSGVGGPPRAHRASGGSVGRALYEEFYALARTKPWWAPWHQAPMAAQVGLVNRWVRREYAPGLIRKAQIEFLESFVPGKAPAGKMFMKSLEADLSRLAAEADEKRLIAEETAKLEERAPRLIQRFMAEREARWATAREQVRRTRVEES